MLSDALETAVCRPLLPFWKYVHHEICVATSICNSSIRLSLLCSFSGYPELVPCFSQLPAVLIVRATNIASTTGLVDCLGSFETTTADPHTIVLNLSSNMDALFILLSRIHTYGSYAIRQLDICRVIPPHTMASLTSRTPATFTGFADCG